MTIPVIDMENTGRNLRMLCRRKGICVKELQSLLNLGSVQSVYDWYHGRTLPSVDNLLALSMLLGVPMEQILVVKGDKRMVSFAEEMAERNVLHAHMRVYYRKLCFQSA